MPVPTVSDTLTALVVAAAEAAGFGGVIDDVEPATPTRNPRFGDYQSNHAFRIGRAQRTNPRAVAEQVRDALPAHPAIVRAAVAGPGFINFHLSEPWLAERLAAMVADEALGIPATGAGKTMVIDYSSPNIAKRMHIGHMRSTIIGNTILRLHQAAGWRTIADNHIGDWGTPIGKLIVAWRGWLDEDNLAADPIGELERLYVSFGERVAVARGEARTPAQEALLSAAREETAKLQSGDPDNLALWRRFMEISRLEREAIYARLGASFDVTLGESFYNDRLSGVVESLLAAGIAEESEGAVIIKYGDDTGIKALKNKTLVVRKADGASLYSTTDLATLEHRRATWDPDRVIYVTDLRQALHFTEVFYAWRQWRAARGEQDVSRPALLHLGFGMLKVDGTITSTRAGDTIRLMDLLNEARRKAREVVDEGSKHVDLSEADKAAIAEAVGVSSIRYFDLSQKPASDVNFTWERAINLQGNTAAFLMYSYARSRSIQRKGGVTAPTAAGIVAVHERERALVRQLLRFPDEVIAALETLRPNLLCEYLYETASALNRFVTDCRVLQSDAAVQASRLALIEATAAVMGRGLRLLGITPLERM